MASTPMPSRPHRALMPTWAAPVVVAALAVCGCGSDVHRAAGDGTTRASSPAGATRLTIIVHRAASGRSGVRTYHLACNPPRGNVPHPAKACSALARAGEPFAPVPRRLICADIVRGEQEARVTGLVGGRHVAAVLTLRGSCEIDRWSRLRDVVPGF